MTKPKEKIRGGKKKMGNRELEEAVRGRRRKRGKSKLKEM